MSKMSRNKGKRIEREAVHFLKTLGYTARRTAQVRGNNDGVADVEVVGLNVHIEVKGDRRIGLGTIALHEACEQAARDANGKPWCVLWWEHRKGWRMSFDAAPTFRFANPMYVTLCTAWTFKMALDALGSNQNRVG